MERRDISLVRQWWGADAGALLGKSKGPGSESLARSARIQGRGSLLEHGWHSARSLLLGAPGVWGRQPCREVSEPKKGVLWGKHVGLEQSFLEGSPAGA